MSEASKLHSEREDLDVEGFGYWPEEAQAAILRRDAKVASLEEQLGVWKERAEVYGASTDSLHLRVHELEEQYEVQRDKIATLEDCHDEAEAEVDRLKEQLAIAETERDDFEASQARLLEQLEALRLALKQIEFASRDPNMAASHAGFLARQALAGSFPAPEPDCYEGNVAANIAGGRYPARQPDVSEGAAGVSPSASENVGNRAATISTAPSETSDPASEPEAS